MSERVFEFSSEEELLSLRPELDCPYCQKAKASHGHLLRRHLKLAVHYSENDTDKFSIPCFCSERQVAKRSHWHCPKCGQIISRSSDLRKHLQNHGLVVTGSPTTGDAKDLPTAQDHSKSNCLKCKVCRLKFAHISNLRRHEKMQHDKERQPIICIDVKNGIFVTPKDHYGPRVPVHVCKSVLSQAISCEVDVCRHFMAIALKRGNPGMECKHLERTNKALAYTPPSLLAEKSLQLMSDRGLISRTAQKECLDMNAKAHSEDIDCVFPVFWDENSISERLIYFSVFTNKKDNWCKFARTRVIFDSQSGKWHCQCREKRRASCTHRYLSMWYMFQEHPRFFKSTANLNLEDTDDVEEIITETEEPCRQCAERSAGVIKMTHKKDLPHELVTKEKPLPESFKPLEGLPAPKRRKETENFGSRCLAQDIYACVYQKIRKKSMHPQGKTIDWVQCDNCSGWLHSECAGTDTSTFETDTPFSCGCHFPEPYPYESVHAAVREGLVVRIITDEEIMALQNDLVSGTLKSNRMYLHQNPTFDPKLKQHRDTCISVFDGKQIEAIIERTLTVLKLDRSKLKNTSFVLEVMVPEVRFNLNQDYSNHGPRGPSTAGFPAFLYLSVRCEASDQSESVIIELTTWEN